MIVDTLGLILGAVVVGADTPEREGGEEVLISIKGLFSRFKMMWADGGFSGEAFAQTAKRLGREVEVVKRSDGVKGFKVLPKRWIVERTFGWLGRYLVAQRYAKLNTNTGLRAGDYIAM